MRSLENVRGRLAPSLMAFATLLVCPANPGGCEPPTATQWQRDVEAERIYEEWRKGNFESALAIARNLVRDYKKAVQESEGKRSSIRTRTISFREAFPHILQKTFVLAQTARMVGDYETARVTLEDLDKDLTRLEVMLCKEGNQALKVRSHSLNKFLGAATGAGMPAGQVDYLTLFSAYQNVFLATQVGDDKAAALAGTVFFHAQVFDEYGTLEIEAGKYKHAEWLFGKSEQYYSYLDIPGDDIAVFRKHLRNHARLLVKQAEADLSEGSSAACVQRLDRAASYLVRVERHLASPARRVAGGGLSQSETAPDPPADWEAADLYFNLAEYCCARADLCEALGHPDTMVFLDRAEANVARASDQLVSLTAALPDDRSALLPSRESDEFSHPFLGYCWLEYAGLNARRVLYSPGGTAKATRTSYAEDMVEYWQRSKRVANGAVKKSGNLFYDTLEKEGVFVEKARMLAEAINQELDEEVASCSTASAPGRFPDPGSRVKRGPDWNVLCHQADGGGEDAEGTVVRIADDGWIIVCWDKTGRETAHRRGGDGRNDVVGLDGSFARPAVMMHPEVRSNPLDGAPPPGAVLAPPASATPGPSPGGAMSPDAARGSRRLRP